MTGQSRAEPWNQITQGMLDVLGEKAQPHQRPGQGNGSVEGCVGRRSEICLEWKRLSSPTATLYPCECVTLVHFYFYKQDPEFPYWSHLPLGYYTSMWGSASDNDIHLPGQLFGSRTGSPQATSHTSSSLRYSVLSASAFQDAETLRSTESLLPHPDLTMAQSRGSPVPVCSHTCHQQASVALVTVKTVVHTRNSRTGEVEAGGPRARGHFPLYKIQVEPGLH